MLAAHGKKHKPWYPVNADGTMKYVYIGELRQNRRLVIDAKGHYGFIDSALNDRIPCIYDTATPFVNNKTLVRKNGKYGILDTAGNELVPIQFDSIGAVKSSDRYFDFLRIIDSIALVKLDGKIGLYNIHSRRTRWIDYVFDAESHWDRLAVRVGYRGDKHALVSDEGETLTPFIYSRIEWWPRHMRVVMRDGYYGFLDSNFREVIPCKYQRVYNYEQGFAAVKYNMCWGFIDMAGKAITPFIYDDVNSFTDGLAAVKLNRKWGLIDTSGHLVTDICYDTVFNFKNGQAEVRYNGKWCRINNTGRRITEWYDTLIENGNDYRRGYTAVKQNGKYGTIDRAGNPAVPCIYDSINYWRYLDESYYNGLLPFMNKSGLIALVDTLGRQHTKFRYDKVKPVYDQYEYDYYSVAVGEKEGLIGYDEGDTTGLIFDEMDFYHRDKPFLPVRIDSNWGLLGLRPIRYLVPVKFSDKYAAIDHYRHTECLRKATALNLQGYAYVNEFHRGRARVRNAGAQYGYINKRGKEVIPCSYADAGEFYQKWSYVEDTGSLNSLINRRGHIIFPWRKEIMIWYGRFGQLCKGEKCGFFDRDGNVTLPCDYYDVQQFARGVFIVRKNGKCGIVNGKGKVIVPFEYDGAIRNQHKYACLTKGDVMEDSEGKEQYYIFNSKGKCMVKLDSSLQVTSMYNNGRIPVKDTSGKYGYINRRGKLVIPCIYASADFFYNHGAVVELKDTLHPYADATGIINKRGKVLMPFKYSYLSTWARHKDMMVKTSKYNGHAYIDHKGRIKTPFAYSQWLITYTTAPHEPKRHFKREGNEWVYRNHRGKVKLRLPATDEPKVD